MLIAFQKIKEIENREEGDDEEGPLEADHWPDAHKVVDEEGEEGPEEAGHYWPDAHEVVDEDGQTEAANWPDAHEVVDEEGEEDYTQAANWPDAHEVVEEEGEKGPTEADHWPDAHEVVDEEGDKGPTEAAHCDDDVDHRLEKLKVKCTKYYLTNLTLFLQQLSCIHNTDKKNLKKNDFSIWNTWLKTT